MACRISVITIVKDHPDGLMRTGNSVVAQNAEVQDQIEWIIVNGSSPGNSTHEVLERFEDYVTWSQSKKDGGIYDAMNIGIEHANGDYLLFMNAGDVIYEHNTLSKVITELQEKTKPDFIFGDYVSQGDLRKAMPFKNPQLTMMTSHQAMFFGRESIGNLRYDMNYKIAADYKLVLEFFKKDRNSLYIDEIITDFEGNGVSHSNAITGAKELFKIRNELELHSFTENVALTAKSFGIYAAKQIMPEFLYNKGRAIYRSIKNNSAISQNQNQKVSVQQKSVIY